MIMEHPLEEPSHGRRNYQQDDFCLVLMLPGKNQLVEDLVRLKSGRIAEKQLKLSSHERMDALGCSGDEVDDLSITSYNVHQVHACVFHERPERNGDEVCNKAIYALQPATHSGTSRSNRTAFNTLFVAFALRKIVRSSWRKNSLAAFWKRMLNRLPLKGSNGML